MLNFNMLKSLNGLLKMIPFVLLFIFISGHALAYSCPQGWSQPIAKEYKHLCIRDTSQQQPVMQCPQGSVKKNVNGSVDCYRQVKIENICPQGYGYVSENKKCHKIIQEFKQFTHNRVVACLNLGYKPESYKFREDGFCYDPSDSKKVSRFCQSDTYNTEIEYGLCHHYEQVTTSKVCPNDNMILQDGFCYESMKAKPSENHTIVSNPNGAWYDMSKDGYGFSMVGTAQGTYVYYYGFDHKNNPLWLLSKDGIADIQAGQAKIIEMQRYEKDKEEAQNWGALTVSFDGCNQAHAELIADNHGDEPTQVYNLVPIAAVADSCQEMQGKNLLVKSSAIGNPSGAWHDEAQKRVGFNLITLQDQQTFVYYYGYDQNGNYLWLLSEEGFKPFVSGEQQTVSMLSHEFKDGKVQKKPEPWGSLNLSLNSCKTGKAILKSKDASVNIEFNDLEIIGQIEGLCK